MSEHRPISLVEIARRYADAAHSIFSPSGSKMWMTCSGSLIPNLLAEDQTSEEAAEGTVAHSVGERWLTKGEDAAEAMVGDIIPVDGHEIEITDEMLAYVGDYVRWCQELEVVAEEFLIETRVDFSDLTPIPDQGGTADCIALVRLGKGRYRLCVRDLKYGKGVRVVAKDNTQGLLYAYGAWKIYRERYNIVEIEIGICHPRLTEGTTLFIVSPEELLEFADYVKERADAAWQPDAPRTPSEAGCQWCKVKANCAALYQHLSEVTSGVFDDDDEFVPRYDRQLQVVANERLEDELGNEPFRFVDPATLSTAALAKVLRYRGVTEQFFAAVEKTLLDRAISDEETIPGWKLVEGRTRRKWPENDAAVYKHLRRNGLKDGAIYDLVLISPAEAEKRLHARARLSKKEAANVVNSLAFKPPGPKSLVRASDPRETLPSDADAFLDDDPLER